MDIKNEIPWIEVDINFPQCPHCGRKCEDIYEDMDDNPNLKIVDVREMYDHYYGVVYHNWRSIIICPRCGGKFQFEDGS